MNRRWTTALSMALAAAVISGIAVFVNGLAVKRFDDATVYTTAKNLIAGSLLVAVVAASPSVRSVSVPRRSWPMLAVVAVVGGAVPFVLFFEGLQRAASTDAAFIHKTLVVWVAVGAPIWLGERVTMVHAGAIGLLVAGHLALTGGGPASFGTGEIMIVAATLLWTVEVLIVKRMMPAVPPTIAAAARMAGGATVLVAWLAVSGRFTDLWALTPIQMAWLVATGATLAAFVATWYQALALAPAVDVTAMLVLGAVITGLLDVGVRRLPITGAEVAGYGLLLLGAAAIARAHATSTPLVRS